MAFSFVIVTLGTSLGWLLVYLNQQRTLRTVLQHNRELSRNLWASQNSQDTEKAMAAASLVHASSSATRDEVRGTTPEQHLAGEPMPFHSVPTDEQLLATQ